MSVKTTLDFLRLVIPEDGYKFIVVALPGNKWKHHPRSTYEYLLKTIEQYDGQPVNIYHANASFVEKSGRSSSNAKLYRAHWLDIDVAKESSPSYETQEQALEALDKFLVDTGMPQPTMVVSSGKGIHVYWCYSTDLLPPEWSAIANRLKELTQIHGLLADPTVTADGARILRPIGTMWHKDGVSLPVHLLSNPKDTPVYEVDAIKQALSVETAPAQAFTMDMNLINAFRVPEGEYISGKPDANLIADRCGQIARFRESGNLPYGLWFDCIGVLIFCEGGEQLVHEWSARGYAGYQYDDTQTKINTWGGTGATLCQTFQGHDPGGPCATCPNARNSPVSLGYGGKAPEVEFVSDEGQLEVFTPVAFPEKAHVGDDGELYYQLKVKVGRGEESREELQWVNICKNPFYLTSLVTEGDHGMSDAVFFPRPGEARKFVIPHKAAQDLKNLRSTLNTAGVFLGDKQTGVLEYTVDYIESLRRKIRDTHTYRQMGWVGRDKFVIGDKLITPTSIEDIRVHGHLAPKADLYQADKPAAEWVDAVDRLYNTPNGRPYQFALCAAMGSVLVPILDHEEYNGIPVALTSDASGFGKSTVCKLALSAWGKTERNKNVITGDEASAGAVEVQCSTFNNVPHLIDEMTNKSANETSHILYMLSNGVARARLRQDGGPREVNPPWKGIPLITGNKNFFLKLTETKLNPEAAQLRVFEIPLENYPKLESLSLAGDLIELTNSVRSGYGAVGTAFIRYVMKNRPAIENQLSAAVKALAASKGVVHTKERFYIYTAAVALVAAKIMNHLELTRFSVPALYQWTLQHLETLRESTAEHLGTPEEDYAAMLNYFLEIGTVLYTHHTHNSGYYLPPKGVDMRVIRDPGIVAVSQRAFRSYCVKHGKAERKFLRELAASGCIDPSSISTKGDKVSILAHQYSLGGGVDTLAVGTMPCYFLNFEKAVGAVDQALEDFEANSRVYAEMPRSINAPENSNYRH